MFLKGQSFNTENKILKYIRKFKKPQKPTNKKSNPMKKSIKKKKKPKTRTFVRKSKKSNNLIISKQYQYPLSLAFPQERPHQNPSQQQQQLCSSCIPLLSPWPAGQDPGLQEQDLVWG